MTSFGELEAPQGARRSDSIAKTRDRFIFKTVRQRDFVRELQEQTAILAQFPESGAFPQDRMLKSSGFRFLTHKDYLLFYRYERAEGRVYIMAIFHGRRDYLRVMQQYL